VSDDGHDTPSQAPPRVKRLRLVAVLAPLLLLAGISTAFGMMMAVASDLPDLENRKEYQDARNSVLYDRNGKQLGVLTNSNRRVLVSWGEISPYVRNAVIAIEDRRFYENSGVDLRGIGRALVQDVIQGRAAQGGSTITQQFVKNAMRAQADRTVFQKLREAALAFHLTRKWPKSKILTQYLNSVYFGNGAYGIEAAARTYFGRVHAGCDVGARARCAKALEPYEAALLAGIIASPSAYDPIAHPNAAFARRNLVLHRMREEGMITALEEFNGRREALPTQQDIEPPDVRTKAPYFTTWVRQQLVERYGARRAFEGGLRVDTTLDLELQAAAERAINAHLANPAGPAAALVAIDNDTGEVRAMVGGRDYNKRPFNLATQGQRQPGSAFKPFTLATALTQGIGPGSVWPSRKREFDVPGGKDKFVVNNFEGNYTGTQTLAGGLTTSDNAVYAAVGLQVGTKRIARTARRMGIRTPVSSNPAMTLGGLRQGVTPLDMAHAYETFAAGGRRVSGTLAAPERGPVGIRSVHLLGSGRLIGDNVPRRTPVLDPAVASTATQILTTVVQQGTGRRAAFGGFAAGKTGTTENSGDAWFVGFTKRLTVAVWVGYADKLKPMLTEFGGKPVEGGTFPAVIWHDFMVAAEGILDGRAAAERAKNGLPPVAGDTTTTPSTAASQPVAPGARVPGEGEAPVGGGSGTGGGSSAASGSSGASGTSGSGSGASGASKGGEADGGQTPAPSPTPAPAPSTPSPAPAAGEAGGAAPTP
jgi:penicillin-binding protein 1A